jgi:CRISPR-associated protein Cmr2
MAGLETPDDHRRAASNLAAFAGCVIDELGGRDDASVIFAGGDDVLALVSLDGALPVVARVAALFRREVADKAAAPLSLSFGVALVHVRENFHDAIRLARRAERAAKDAGGGRLAMALAKRAGRDVRLVLPLDDVQAGRIENTVRLLRDRDLPGGLAHELEVLADRIQDAHPELRTAELRRVFARKRADRGERPVDEAVLAWLVSRVTRAPDASGYPSFTEQVKELVSLLLVGAHLASHIQPSTFARRRATVRPAGRHGGLP